MFIGTQLMYPPRSSHVRIHTLQTEGTLATDVRSSESLFKYFVGEIEEVESTEEDEEEEGAGDATKKKKKKKKRGKKGGGGVGE